MLFSIIRYYSGASRTKNINHPTTMYVHPIKIRQLEPGKETTVVKCEVVALPSSM